MIDRTLCRCTPPHDGRLPTAAAALLLTAGFALWLALPATGLWVLGRIGAIGLITAGLYLALRWLARVYTYSLEQHENGQIDFVVTEQNGRRCTTVCRVALDTVTAITEQIGGHPRPRGITYHYLNAPRPSSACILTCADPNGDRHIRITPDTDLLRLLTMLGPAKKSEDFYDEFGKSP